MNPARALWLWHCEQTKLAKEHAELAEIAALARSQEEKLATLEQQLADYEHTSDPDEEIARLLLEQELWLAKKAIERHEQESRERVRELEERIMEHEYTVLTLKQDVQQAYLDLYEQLAQTKANPIVPVQNDSCMGCFYPLSLQNRSEWQRGKELVTCAECGRILV